MKKIFTIIFILLSSCRYRFPLLNLNIENAIADLTHGKLVVLDSMPYRETIYEDGENFYIEIPQIPAGFFLYYHLDSLLPILSHVNNQPQDGWKHDLFKISKIFFYNDAFVVLSDDSFYKADYIRGNYMPIQLLEDGIIRTITFNPVQPSFGWFGTGKGLFSFHVKRKGKLEELIGGVYKFEIGLYDAKYHIWGESVYGFFDIDLDTLSICFPIDRTPYSNPLHTYNNIISKDYMTKISNSIGRREKIESFSITARIGVRP